MISMRNLRHGAALAALATATALFAQDVTGTIRGSVTDDAGGGIANATVTVTHVPSGTRTTVATDADGGFSATNLRIGGPFSVQVAANGFDAASQTIAQIAPGQPVRVDVFLVPAGQTIAVTANRTRSSIAIASGPATLLNAEQIEGVASVNRDIRDLARRDPFVNLDSTNSRALQIAGQNNRFNRLTVDGVAFGDPFGLNNGGLPSARGPIPFDAIGQFTVEIAPADIQQGGFQGGALNAVLRSGGNEFSGQAGYFYSGDGLAGNRVGNLPVTQKFNSDIATAQLTGPIVQDKLFFAVTYERTRNTVAADVGLAGEGFLNSIPRLTRAQVDQIRNIAQTNYRYDALNVPTSVPEKDDKLAAKVDWNIADGHRAAFTYIYNQGTLFQGQTPTSTLNATAPTLSLQSNSYELAERNHYGVIQLNDEWSDSFSTQARVTYTDYKRGQAPYNGRTFGEFTVCGDATSIGSLTNCNLPVPAPQIPGTNPPQFFAQTGQVAFGPDISRQLNELRVKSWSFEFQARLRRNDHDVKFIAERRQQDINNLFVQRASGQFYFDSIADFQAGRANRLQLGVPITGNLNDAAAIFRNITYTFGVQDVWDLTDNFTFVYGFRYDLYDAPDDVPLNVNFVARNGFANNATLSGRGVLQPRFGFNYRGVEDRLKLRGSAGLYAGGSPNVWISNSYSNPGTVVNAIDIQRTATGFTGVADFGGFTGNQIGAAALNGVTGGTGIPSIVTQFAARGVPALAVVNAIDPNFRIPSQWRLALSADYDLDLGPLGDRWNIGADVIYGRVKDALTWTDLRSVPNGVLPDGRPRYAQRTNNLGTGGTILADTNQDILLTNTGRGYSWNLAARLFKEFDSGVFMGGSYTFQRAKDVNPGTSSVALSNYNNAASADPNQAAYGTSNYQTANTLKLSLGISREFIKDARTRIELFFDSRAGQPFSYTFADTAAGRSPVFGTTGTNTRYLLYVPNVSSASADPRVTYAPGFDFAGFQQFVQNSVLNQYQGQIAPKNIGRAPRFNKLDLSIRQEVPLFGRARVELFGDMENVLNFINKDWGQLQQVAFPYYGTLVNVSCQDAAGAAVTSPAQACARYVYANRTGTAFQQPAQSLFVGQSLWQIRVGAKFRF